MRKKFSPIFLVDRDGKPVAVQLDIKSYRALLEEIEDTYDVKRAEEIIEKKSKTHTIEELERSIFGKGK